jgi:hypothetical protein
MPHSLSPIERFRPAVQAQRLYACRRSCRLPQQASLFVAGRIAPGLGSFVQLTYTQEDGEIAMDNAELRYSRQKTVKGKPVTFGELLNNNPTVEDLWSSTPAWGFPWAAPDVASGPIASTLIDRAVDFQYERAIGSRNLVVHGTYIDEHADLQASDAAGLAGTPDSDFSTLRVDASLHGPKMTYVVGYQRGRGSADSVRFGPEVAVGSAAGRSASDNNTLLLHAWFVW